MCEPPLPVVRSSRCPAAVLLELADVDTSERQGGGHPPGEGLAGDRGMRRHIGQEQGRRPSHPILFNLK